MGAIIINMKKSNAAADELKSDLTKIGDNSLMFVLNFSTLISLIFRTFCGPNISKMKILIVSIISGIIFKIWFAWSNIAGKSKINETTMIKIKRRLNPKAVAMRYIPKVSNLSAKGSHKYAIIAPKANGAIMSANNYIDTIVKIIASA